MLLCNTNSEGKYEISCASNIYFLLLYFQLKANRLYHDELVQLFAFFNPGIHNNCMLGTGVTPPSATDPLLSKKNYLNQYPVHVACMFGNEKSLSALLKHETVVKQLNEQDLFGFSCIHLAFMFNHAHLILLLKPFMTSNMFDKFGSNPLHRAAEFNAIDAVKQAFICIPESILMPMMKQTDSNELLPIHISILHDGVEMFDYLFAKFYQLNVNMKTKQSDNIAIKCCLKSFANFLLLSTMLRITKKDCCNK